MKQVSQIASRDISKAVSGMNPDSYEIFNVTSSHVFTAESRRLNRELGIHAVNKSA